jgi:hypothetical protein
MAGSRESDPIARDATAQPRGELLDAISEDRGVILDLIHALPHPDERREVIDGVHAIERQSHRGAVSHVPHDQLHVLVQIRRAAPLRAVDLGDQAIEDSNLVPRTKQLVCEVRADEAGATGDEDLLGQDNVLSRRLLERCRAIVTTAASAAEAFDLLRGSPRPDVIVSDIGMPDEGPRHCRVQLPMTASTTCAARPSRSASCTAMAARHAGPRSQAGSSREPHRALPRANSVLPDAGRSSSKAVHTAAPYARWAVAA